VIFVSGRPFGDVRGHVGRCCALGSTALSARACFTFSVRSRRTPADAFTAALDLPGLCPGGPTPRAGGRASPRAGEKRSLQNIVVGIVSASLRSPRPFALATVDLARRGRRCRNAVRDLGPGGCAHPAGVQVVGALPFTRTPVKARAREGRRRTPSTLAAEAAEVSPNGTFGGGRTARHLAGERRGGGRS